MTTRPPAGRVLCVDDEAVIRAVLCDILTDDGFDVRTATNGAAALDLLDSSAADGWRPDVVLLDINMPVMDGYAFAQAYRERAGAAPMIVITAGERLPDAAERAGAAAYVAKPFDLDALLDIVRTHQRAA
ncbi:MAG TPA: response regulator [Chloroflexota bacterium]|nr:response regulator [Chloroflexota bacterium]